MNFDETAACWSWHRALTSENAAAAQATNILTNLEALGVCQPEMALELGTVLAQIKDRS